jgi:hypothetical protein
MVTQPRSHGVASQDELRRMQDADERSIGAATRATFWFVAIVVLLIWAGVSDAAPADAACPTDWVRSSG